MKCTRIGGKRCNCSCFEIDQEMDAILFIICIFYGVCRIVIKSVQQCTYFLFSVNLLLVGVNLRTQNHASLQLISDKIQIIRFYLSLVRSVAYGEGEVKLFACKEIINRWQFSFSKGEKWYDKLFNVKYLTLFHHFKAIYQFPKHIIFLVKIVANASLNVNAKVYTLLKLIKNLLFNCVEMGSSRIVYIYNILNTLFFILC
jgi:hypothetical protein